MISPPIEYRGVTIDGPERYILIFYSSSSASGSGSSEDSAGEQVDTVDDEYNSEEDSDFDPYELLEPLPKSSITEDDELEQLEPECSLSNLVEDAKEDDSISGGDDDSLNYRYETDGGDDASTSRYEGRHVQWRPSSSSSSAS
eukprot:CAMPEP_0178513930 /NCGR_PEP_ID=MMETSP0696-20121128/23747_1 /TAXON_ID=265572 /ORGANISM="Extubocellulus spinifer, Strain CCMP396" /LENGTH=142 /DNA_ID=CAMNT_0020143981 /DNA_START=421 /DNA_END=851 /DNA_ORIENTATION=+